MTTSSEGTPDITSDEAAANRKRWATDGYAWFMAYQEAGFTEEQAMRLLVAVSGRSMAAAPPPPEFSEFMAKMSALLNRDLADG